MMTDYTFEGFDPANTTPVPDVFFDRLLPHLNEAQLKVMLYIIRRTLGFKKTSDAISLTQFRYGIKVRATGEQLDEGCGLKNMTTISNAAKSLEQMGCIERDPNTSPEGDQATTVYRIRFRGTTPTVVPPTRNVSPTTPTVVEGYYAKRSTGTTPNGVRVLRQTYSQETVIQQTDKQETVRDTDGATASASHSAPTLFPHPEYDFIRFDDLMMPTLMVVTLLSTDAGTDEDKQRIYLASWKVMPVLLEKGLKVDLRYEYEKPPQNENHYHNQEETLQDDDVTGLHRDIQPPVGNSIRDRVLPPQDVASDPGTTETVTGVLSYSPKRQQGRGEVDDDLQDSTHHRVAGQSQRDRVHGCSSVTPSELATTQPTATAALNSTSVRDVTQAATPVVVGCDPTPSRSGGKRKGDATATGVGGKASKKERALKAVLTPEEQLAKESQLVQDIVYEWVSIFKHKPVTDTMIKHGRELARWVPEPGEIKACREWLYASNPDWYRAKGMNLGNLAGENGFEKFRSLKDAPQPQTQAAADDTPSWVPSGVRYSGRFQASRRPLSSFDDPNFGQEQLEKEFYPERKVVNHAAAF